MPALGKNVVFFVFIIITKVNCEEYQSCNNLCNYIDILSKQNNFNDSFIISHYNRLRIPIKKNICTQKMTLRNVNCSQLFQTLVKILPKKTEIITTPPSPNPTTESSNPITLQSNPTTLTSDLITLLSNPTTLSSNRTTLPSNTTIKISPINKKSSNNTTGEDGKDVQNEHNNLPVILSVTLSFLGLVGSVSVFVYLKKKKENMESYELFNVEWFNQ